MKLTVIEDRKRADTINSNISEYANTQNRIQTADWYQTIHFIKKLKIYLDLPMCHQEKAA